ncbi:MAG TPA: N-acetyltransferase family protein [Thermoanaerobaculia bacterium]|nr:N-acetyltransferase family protein [Thermoanaerobaculia bacterium]HUM31078.1 N-acetyltransferase family protein [Thermoanaerobaculia bacterium]HXK69410.1 N-acetyltransferase family protein [Thermoanaerobaculia bacterium]
MDIRTATRDDLSTIIDIYNQAVEEGFRTADLTPVRLDERIDWFNLHNPSTYPIYVMTEDKKIIGWCSVSPYRPGREALRTAAEISYYVDRNFRKRGIAMRLILHAIEQAPLLGLRHFFAILLDVNEASVRLLERCGFKRWGHLPDIASIKDTRCGQFIYGREI